MQADMSSPRPISAIRLDGGRLCIDFANSIHDRFASVAEDYLATPERYAEWARRTGAADAVVLPGSAEARHRLMAELGELREAVFRILVAHIDGLPYPADALRIANAWLLEARTAQELADGGALRLRADRSDGRLPLMRIVLDLVDVLADANAGKFKLKHCANQMTCGWIFADTSKNGRRRWCAMDTCGVQHKMATLRRRAAEAPGAA
jgi:predicted RNA-binding Zn ribbon-like protein